MPMTWPSPETRWPTFRRFTSAPTAAISPAYSWPIVIGVGIVFCAHSSQLKMWTSVPQMPVLLIFTSTSSGPICGTGWSSSQRPGSGLALTRAFIVAPLDRALANPSLDRKAAKRSRASCLHPRTPPPPRPRPRRSAPPTSGCGCEPAPSARREKEPRDIDAAPVERAARSCASCASPSMTGMIGVTPGRVLKPAASRPARKRCVWRCSSARRSSDRIAISSAFRRAGGDRRAERVGEEIGPRALAQKVDDRLRRGDEAAHAAAERLAERAGDDVDPVARAGQRRRAAPLTRQDGRSRGSRRPAPSRRNARRARRSPGAWRHTRPSRRRRRSRSA